jgi:hypothetical protein
MRSAAAAQNHEEQNGSDDGDEERTETAEAIRKEGKHLPCIAPARPGGLMIRT